jgi:hypothetical protein
MQESKKNWVPTSYLQEEDKIRHQVFFILQVAQFKKAKGFLYNELPTRAMEVRESQGRHWVRQGWSNATGESMRKSGRERKDTKEGKKVAPAKATFRVSQTKNSFFWFTSIGERPILIEVSAPGLFFYEEAVCKGSSRNGLLNTAKAVP